jgi:hypothetical protein
MHPLERGVAVAGRKGLAFVPNAVNSNYAAALYKEPEHARIQLADMAQFKQAVADRFGQWLAMILAIPQLRQTLQDRRVIIGVALFEFIQELLNWRTSVRIDVELYGEFHVNATSKLMFQVMP